MEITLTHDQQIAFQKIRNFLETDIEIFILKGYAGTGKTTLIKSLYLELKNQSKSCLLFAPTGRAAKVMRDSIGEGQTIHSGIYSKKIICTEIDNPDESQKLLQYHFPVKEVFDDEKIIIVDESSMISDTETNNEFFTFGSGRLLTDLLYFAKCNSSKILFVGDPAQLPPVTDKNSSALDIGYFTELGYKTDSYELREVIRQKNDSGILDSSIVIRNTLLLDRKERHSLILEDNSHDIFEVRSVDVVERYTSLFPIPEVGNGVVVAYSNKQCYEYNVRIRNKLFPNQEQVTIGDILLINNNNYHTFGTSFYNGDMVKVIRVGSLVYHKNIPVTIKDEKRHIDLTFREIEIITPNTNEVITCNILEDFLYSPERDLTIWQMRALYIDFCMKHKDLKEGSDDFKDALKNDIFFNALHVKFGYAITCHKSQGGEWDSVFVDYYGRCGLADDHLRWCYTATTRAKKFLFIINPPHITSLSKLSFGDIGKITKAPTDFWQSHEISTPFHNDSVTYPVRLKCLGVINALQDTEFRINDIQSCSYTEKYSFVNERGKRIQLDAYYDGSGFFRPFTIQTNDDSDEVLIKNLFNKAMAYPDELSYTPSNNSMNDLYQRVISEALELNIKVVNIVECIEKYYVNYYLITSARFAVIQFYFKETGFSKALPKSELGIDDKLLIELIKRLEDVI